MADFNPELGISPTQIPDQSGASRGIPTNRAFETLLSGVADVAKGAAQTVDTSVQTAIRADVENYQDGLNQKMGLGPQAATDQVVSAFDNGKDKVAPQELSSAKARMGKMTSAYNQGVFSQSAYWDQMTTFARELRTRYPGYNQQIDQIIDDVTGSRSPANRLRNELDQGYTNQINATTTAGKTLDAELYKNKEAINIMHPGFFQPEKFNQASTLEKQKALADGIDFQSKNEQLKSQNLEIDNQDKLGALEKTKSVNWLNDSASLVVYKGMNQVLNGAGVTGTNVAQKIQQALTNPPNDKQIIELQANVQKWRVNIRSELDKLLLTPAGRNVSKTQFDDITQKAMSQVDFYADLINNKDTGIAVQQANATKLAQDRQLNTALGNDVFMKLWVAGKISPDLQRSIALQHWNDLENVLMPGYLSGTVSGDTKADDVTTDISSQKRLSSAEKSGLTTKYVKEFTTLFSDKNVSDQQVSDMIKGNFNGTEGLSKTFSLVNEEDRYKLFATLTAPSVTDRIAALSDPEAKTTYANWVKDKFTSIKDVRLAAGNIQGASSSNIHFKYDPKTYTFAVLPPDLNEQNRMNVDPNAIRAQMEAQQLVISHFNADLANVGYAMKKLGQDPGVEIPKLLNILHIQNQGQGKQSSVPQLQKAVIASNEGGQTPGFAPGDEMLHLGQGESANPFITGTANNLLNYVSQPESKGNYNAYINHINSNYDLSQLTLDGVLKLQGALVKAGNPSGAIGKYQIIEGTLRGLKTNLGLSGDEPFTPELQNKLGMALLVGRGFKEWSAGGLSDKQFAKNLALEWAALPDPDTGQSAYAGIGKNAAGVSTEDVMKALSESRDDAPGGAGNDRLDPTQKTLEAFNAFHNGTLEENIQNFLRPDVNGNEGQSNLDSGGTDSELGKQDYKASPQEIKEGYMPQGMPAKLPMGWINNNPGNLKYSGSAFQQQYFKGISKSDSKDQGAYQAKFETPEDGLAAMATLALVKNQNGKDTIKKLMFDKGGYTPGYKSALNNISNRMDKKGNESLDLSDRNQMFTFMRSLLVQELGYPANAYSDELVNKAIDRAYDNRKGYDPSLDKTHPDYKKLNKSVISGNQGRNKILGGDHNTKWFDQSIVYKDHLEEAGKQIGTFDANKLPDGEGYPTEDRRGEVLTKEQINQRFIDAQLKARNDMVWRHIANQIFSPNDITGIDAALKAFEADPEKYVEENSIPEGERDQFLIDSLNRDTLLKKSDKGDFSGKRESDTVHYDLQGMTDDEFEQYKNDVNRRLDEAITDGPDKDLLKEQTNLNKEIQRRGDSRIQKGPEQVPKVTKSKNNTRQNQRSKVRNNHRSKVNPQSKPDIQNWNKAPE